MWSEMLSCQNLSIEYMNGEVPDLRENVPRNQGLGRQDLGGRSGIAGEERDDKGALAGRRKNQSVGAQMLLCRRFEAEGDVFLEGPEQNLVTQDSTDRREAKSVSSTRHAKRSL